MSENDGREQDGRFAKGNKGGPGGPRPGSGRKPKPSDPSLLQELYDILDQAAPEALRIVREKLNSKDERVQLDACKLILGKTLPEVSRVDVNRREEAPGTSIESITEEERAKLFDLAKAYAELRLGIKGLQEG